MILKVKGRYDDNLIKLKILIKRHLKIEPNGNLELKNTINEMKNSLERLNRFELTEELENSKVDCMQSKEQREIRMKKMKRLREMQDTSKQNNMHLMGAPEGEEGGKGAKNYS